jgi:transposase
MPLVTGHAPGLLALHGVGSGTAALLLIAAGDHPERLRSEAARAHLCAVAPIPASSGKTVRRRHCPAGDRQANHALWRIVITRMSSRPPTRAYARTAHRRGPVQERDHALPETLRRPRGLPPSPRRRPLTAPLAPGTA